MSRRAAKRRESQQFVKASTLQTRRECNGTNSFTSPGASDDTMTALNDPDTIRHFQALCDACQDLIDRGYGPFEQRLYADGYLHCLRRSQQLNLLHQQRLEAMIERWILDPSSFIGPNGNHRTLFQPPQYP